MSNSSQPRHPRFCRHCGAALPPDNPRFCIECGGALSSSTAEAPPEPARPSAAAGPTVKLPNARVGQSVVGGTVKLPTSGAWPPGLWVVDEPPGDRDVIAIYAPLRAIVGGWSGLVGSDWQRDGQGAAGSDSTAQQFSFTTMREWFPAQGCGGGLKLRVYLRAQSEAEEGRSRRGFRYRVSYDPPMEVVRAEWVDAATGRKQERPLPEIQIMAPPRIPRVSDIDESIVVLPEADTEAWAREGVVFDRLDLLNTSQQRTPAGRGLPLGVPGALQGTFRRLRGDVPQFMVQAITPLFCRWPEWGALERRMQDDARKLGLDFDTDAVAEWWLDQKGHDCVVLDNARQLYGCDRAVIAFRRGQIARIAKDILR